MRRQHRAARTDGPVAPLLVYGLLAEPCGMLSLFVAREARREPLRSLW